MLTVIELLNQLPSSTTKYRNIFVIVIEALDVIIIVMILCNSAQPWRSGNQVGENKEQGRIANKSEGREPERLQGDYN